MSGILRGTVRRLGDNVTLEEIPGGLHDLVLSQPDVREKVLTAMEYFIGKTQKA